MNADNNQNRKSSASFLQMVNHNITPIDLFILNQLNEGKTNEQIRQDLLTKYGIKEAEELIEDRKNKLLFDEDPKNMIVLNKHPQYLIDLTKFFDHMFLLLIKAKLTSFEKKTMNLTIQDVYEKIIEVNNKPIFKNPLKLLYTISNGYTFNFFGVVCENNLSRFNGFKDYLLKEGIADSIDVFPVDITGNSLNNMNSTPDQNELKSFLLNYKGRMEQMIDELTKKEIISTKTTRYFNHQEYNLLALNGKEKGEVYLFDKSELKIGRYYDNDIIINDLKVSRRHAKISKIGDIFVFKDQSTNGSYVNKESLNHNEQELKEGDTITIGKMKFKFSKVKIDQ